MSSRTRGIMFEADIVSLTYVWEFDDTLSKCDDYLTPLKCASVTHNLPTYVMHQIVMAEARTIRWEAAHGQKYTDFYNFAPRQPLT